MDVWFDSGSHPAQPWSRSAKAELHFPADVYLEGGDQYRGWFQSSMLTSIATQGRGSLQDRSSPTAWTVDE